MKAAIVPQAGTTRVYGDFKEPAPVSGESRIAVTAAATVGDVSTAHYRSGTRSARLKRARTGTQ